jgi:hypothetical protein
MLQYDVHIVIGEGQAYPLAMVVPAIGVSIANQGFCTLIGREILDHCVLRYDGPKQEFFINYGQTERGGESDLGLGCTRARKKGDWLPALSYASNASKNLAGRVPVPPFSERLPSVSR